MGKKSKKNKVKKKKLKEDRLNEINEIKEKLKNHGLTESFENINKLFEIFDKYIETGISETGKLPLPGLKREIHYILTSKYHVQNNITLKYNENI